MQAKSNAELIKELEAMAARITHVRNIDPPDSPTYVPAHATEADATPAIIGAEGLAELLNAAALRLSAMNITGGIADVIFERERQVEQERFDPEHDDQHIGGELAIAAACYFNPNPRGPAGVPAAWPWDARWWKPAADPRIDTPADYRRRLIKGTALGIAEIDRFDRSAARRAVEG